MKPGKIIHVDEIDEFIEIGEKGGAGSQVPWWELLDFRALDLIAVRATAGVRKYARDNWRACPWQEHVRHAVRHAFRALEPGQQQRSPAEAREQVLDELAGFLCRAMMAVGVFLQDPGVEDVVPTGLAITARVAARVKKMVLD